MWAPYWAHNNIVFAMRILPLDFQRFADIFRSQNLASRQHRGARCAVNVNAYVVKAVVVSVLAYLQCLQIWSSIHP